MIQPPLVSRVLLVLLTAATLLSGCAATRSLFRDRSAEERAAALLFPAVSRLRSVSFEIAMAVAHQAIQDGVADVEHDDVERLVREARWLHDYPEYVPT